MATETRNKLLSLYTGVPTGMALTPDDLAQLGISRDLALHYANSGWLQRLGHGVYASPTDRLEVHGCLTVLQKKIKGLHVGGKICP